MAHRIFFPATDDERGRIGRLRLFSIGSEIAAIVSWRSAGLQFRVFARSTEARSFAPAMEFAIDAYFRHHLDRIEIEIDDDVRRYAASALLCVEH